MEQQEYCAVNVLKNNLNVKEKSDMEEMFFQSVTDSESDMEVPQVKNKKMDNSKALVIFSL